MMPLEGTYSPSPSKWARDQAERIEESGGTKGLTLNGKPVILLTTVGARTGCLRKTPLMRVEHKGRYAVVASRGGAAKNPQWYFNLIANPLCELRDGTYLGDFRAREVTGEEKQTWWDRALEVWPDYAGYQRKTSRVIPVFVLEPVGPVE
jgi:deazaflavin-dependent oxidoreductase (nitroreductase family)